MSAWISLIRQKKARGGILPREETLALEDAREDEFIRRYDALYGAGRVNRAWGKLKAAILALAGRGKHA